ncbi:MAG: DUF3179 domain-containing protein [Alphaproteobacteria bacterium]
MLHRSGSIIGAVLAVLLASSPIARGQTVFEWVDEFPRTDFSQRAIPLKEIVSDGAVRDSIPPIDDPVFVPVSEAGDVGDLEPVLSIGIEGDFRAYPLRILLWHEIVNDVVGGVPVLVSYCPLCNSGVVFDRRLDDEVLEFGNTGRIRHFDMVMYDKSTESWWQQFLGEALVGARTGQRLKPLPARLESLARFRERAPDGKLLVPNDDTARPYGETPYEGMDSTPLPPSLARQRFPYDLPPNVDPLARVVVVGDEAWTLGLLRATGTLERGDLVLTWVPGQNSIHDASMISEGRDVGNVIVQRRTEDGLVDTPYDVTFAFAFGAFVPAGTLHTE